MKSTSAVKFALSKTTVARTLVTKSMPARVKDTMSTRLDMTSVLRADRVSDRVSASGNPTLRFSGNVSGKGVPCQWSGKNCFSPIKRIRYFFVFHHEPASLLSTLLVLVPITAVINTQF